MGIDRVNLRTRILTGVVGVLLLLLAFYLGGWFYSLVISLIALLAFIEYVQISWHMHKRIPAGLAGLAGMLYMANSLFHFEMGAATIFVPIFVLMCLESILRYPDMKFDDLTMGFFGTFYIFLLFSYFFELRALPHGFLWTLSIMVFIWIGDSAAYFVGTRFGKRPLANRLSPNKSVEGALGSLVFTMLSVVLMGWYFQLFSPLIGLIFGALISVTGIFGDLFESLLKRTAGVKDSGKLLPGHGGILDRFDSALFVVPIAYFFIRYIIL